MTQTPITPDSDTSEMSNGVNGFHKEIEKLHVNGDTSGYSSSEGEGERRKTLPRKHSSPMMPAFMVSAPGKVIVFGEHAVVYGKAAIAASISLRSYLLVTHLSKSKRTVTMQFPDIDLVHTWNIDDLPWDKFQQPSKKKYYYDLVTALDPDLVHAMQPHLADISPNKSDAERKIHQNSAASFLYLFLSLGSPKSHGCIYTLRSTIPIGAGVGSSASIAVCLAAAMLLQIRTLSGPHPDQPADEARLQMERINRWAFVAEMCIHGNPSGVDNTVATHGKAVVYQRTDYKKPPTVTPLWDFPELPLLLVDTRIPKSTAAEVAKVGKLKSTHQELVGSILDAVDKITRSAESLIDEEYFDSEEPESLRRMGELMTINHGLLSALGVSHPRLERVRELVDHEGIGFTKLTGAGGGGCSISLMKPDTPREKLEKLDHQLEKEGYRKFRTTLGGDGVGVLWPAVLKNGLDEDEEGGMEIDLDKFLKAPGNDGVEKLVGVSSGLGEAEREGWKFWRVESQ
ncbi:mevalonate kinase [Hypoxylon trugodes]|uniref:mevalonate kinase n=1 Tax=Hypoxylon trugodes TaxID=326681 RepID=UPI00219ADFC4|nr:mevalonate kinase [Hypoxylon trugodes]KAI1391481.1 mevalonate kinase [Hypoxylon trugodes]